MDTFSCRRSVNISTSRLPSSIRVAAMIRISTMMTG